MPVKAKSALIAAVILLIVFQLFILFYIKYENQNLTIENLDLSATGNIINVFFTFFLLLGIILYIVKYRGYEFKPVIIYTIITSILILFCLLSLYISIPENSIYIYEQTLNKFIIGFIFSLYQFVQFAFISFLWLSLFSQKDFIFIRVVFNSIIIVIVLLLAAYFYIEIKMNSYSDNWKYSGEHNIAVVLGAAVWSYNKPSPTLASRADKAVKMYRKQIVNKIQVTGSNAPGELSEAEVALNYILNKDVDSASVLFEDKTTSTAEQIRFIKNNIFTSGKFDNIFIISDEYHLARVSEISRFYNLKVIVAASELELSFNSKLYNRIRESIGLSLFWCFAL